MGKPIKLVTASGEVIGKVEKISVFQATGYTELTLIVSPHYDGMKRIERAAKEGVIVLDGLEETRSP